MRIKGILLAFFLLLPTFVFSEDIKEIRIGVLAYRGKQEAIKRWSPTAAYLTLAIPRYRFSVIPLDFNEIGPATRYKKIDFVITNTSIYVELESAYGVTRIATLNNRWKDKGYTTFGGVIFTRADREDIKELKDLKGKTFMAVDETSLGGWRMAWREMKDRGITPVKLKELRFGKTHDRVVMAVLNREVDAGTVRTDIIERMFEIGKIDIKDLKIINEQKVEGFPFLLSTRLYPEWPFARLRHVPEELSARVAIALMSMPHDSMAAKSSGSSGWTTPLDYYPVHELMKELKVGPYKDFGKMTFRSFAEKYWYLILLTLLIILILTVLVIVIARLNKRLRGLNLRIQHAMDGLEIIVKDRTAELERRNRELYLQIEKEKGLVKQLRESEEKFKNLVEQLLIGVYIIQDGHFIYVNPRMANMFGYEPAELINKKTPYDLIVEEYHYKVRENIKKRLDGEVKTAHYTFKGKKKDGSIIDVEVLGFAASIDGRPAVIGSIRDITEEVRRDKEKESAKRFLQSILDCIPDEIMVIRPDYTVEFMNAMPRERIKEDSFCFRISHGRDLPCDGLEHQCPLKEVLEKKKEVTTIHKHLQSDGSERIVEIRAVPVFSERSDIIYVVEASRDITERLRLEEENRKLLERLYIEDKERALLTLTGGIAHDFNNLLMSVLGSAELLKMSKGEKDLPYIERIIETSEKMANLVRQMLAYTGQVVYQPSNMNLNESIINVLNMTHRGIYNDIRVDLNLEENLWPVYADRTQIEQALIDLILNAFEAIEEKGGTLRIKTQNIKITAPIGCYPLKQILSEGEYVQIRISDTGPGIPEDLHTRIFEPFFSTKFMGRGLGLSAAKGIIKSHNGYICLESKEGTGATFIIYLPRALKTDEIKETMPHRMTRGILVVDDDETILNLINETLSVAGYNVYAARDGLTALNIFKEVQDIVGLALIDIEMPAMDGRKLISELRSIAKNIKIIVSSGYDETTAIRGINPLPEAFIQKPYRLSALISKVKDIVG